VEEQTSSAVPAEREAHGSALPAVPTRVEPPQPPPPPVSASLGWTIVTLATVALALASFDLYPDDAPGMWAGYRDLVLILVLGYSLCLLRCDLPKTPFIGACGLVGVLLILEGVFLASTLFISFPQIACGAVILIGTALMAAARER
jgi:hypothetical protein